MIDRPLRILQVNTLDMRGGAARVAWNLFQGYRAHGQNSWLAVVCKESQDRDVLLIKNDDYRSRLVRICAYIERHLSKLKRNVRGIGRLSAMMRYLANPKRHIGISLGREDFSHPATQHLLDLLAQKPDILHCHNLHGSYFDLRALPALSKNIPTVITLHDAWLLSGHCAHSFNCQRWKSGCGSCPNLDIYPSAARDSTSYNWRLKRDIYKNAKLYVITPSEWLMKKVEQSILVPSILKKRVMPNGVDLKMFYPGDKRDARNRLGLPQAADILLFVSQCVKESQWRDYNMLEETIRCLSENPRPRPLILICLGEGRESEYFKNTEIRFVPFQLDTEVVSRYYQSADICLHPAKEDNFPSAVIESLASGTPVVSTNTGGIQEIIEDNKTGFLVAPRDSRHMARMVEKLLSDNGLLRSFSEKAVDAARRRFDLDSQIKSHLCWYKEIIEENQLLNNNGSS
ncbi:MAG: glycosyltransferase [Candidatus Omnitrophota bacterium]